MNLRTAIISAILLLTAGMPRAQERISADSLSTLFLEHYASVPREKIFVHTDKAYYASGDTVWFRTYVVDRAANKLSDRSKFVYLELLDNEADTLVSRIKVKADTAEVFANAIPLASGMRSGTYTLTAYTRWMQNFGEETFFKKMLTVVNRNDSVAPHSSQRMINAIALSVMPEGGNLLAGHMQKVAFKAVGDDGLGVDVDVRLVNAGGDVIREGASQHLGMGYIPVNADSGEELWLEAFTRDGLSCRTKLPPAQASGATLTVSQRNGTVLIQPYITPSIDATGIAVAIYGSGNLIVKELAGTSPLRISTRDLRPGVVNIALIDRSTRHTLAERLIFVRDTNPLPLQITSD